VTTITYVWSFGGLKKIQWEDGMSSINNLISSAELREELERLSTIVKKPKGSILFRRGDKPVGLFLVRKGRVGLCLDCETKAYPMRKLGFGAIVGLPASVSGKPYSLTAEVLQDSELAFVPRHLVVSCLKNNPILGFEVISMLSGEICDVRSVFKANTSDIHATA
jgi:CRP-like cAMP-binding protein